MSQSGSEHNAKTALDLHVQERVAVIICTYNNSRILRRTLESLTELLIPAGLHWELLLVDNNSSDDTSGVVAQFSERLPLRYAFERRQGLAHARRRGLRETSGELIAFVDDDCLLAADWLAQAVSFCRDRPSAGAVGGKVQLLWEVPPDEFLVRYGDDLAQQNFGENPLRLPSVGWALLVGAGLVVRRTSLETSGWVNQGVLIDRQGKAVTSGGDSEMVLRIRNAGYEVWYNPAMNLQHCIPKWRMSFNYLCKIHRSNGRILPFLTCLADNRRPYVAWCLRDSASALRRLAHSSLAVLVDRVQWKREGRPDRLLLLHEHLGYVEGALKLLSSTLRARIARTLRLHPASRAFSLLL